MNFINYIYTDQQEKTTFEDITSYNMLQANIIEKWRDFAVMQSWGGGGFYFNDIYRLHPTVQIELEFL